jgi:hypothetical protein
LRLGTIIGKGRPKGMLEDFLGKDIISHAWSK